MSQSLPTREPISAIEATLLKLLSRRARVVAAESIGSRFRLLTLRGKELCDREWTPGSMVQISLGGWQARAYTPCTYEPHQGTIAFLGYVHGHGIGSSWLTEPPSDELLSLVGPRHAVDLNALTRPAVLFGDETSISTAAALHATADGPRGVRCWFEVDSVAEARQALERFGLHDAELFLRREGDQHLDELTQRLLSEFAAEPSTRALLTGKAGSIQRLYKALRGAGVPSKHVRNIAYWAPGRKGLSGAQK